ncbi:MAG: energy transducer TonB [Chitinophagaceae bacterium]|nr:energy transducer TonB [Chitinophagaceae bacterium]
MRCKIFIFYLILFFICSSSFSQNKKFIYYFDSELNSADKQKSMFTGTGSMENNLLKLHVIHNTTKQTVILAGYTDSSLTVSQGLYQSYFANGTKESDGYYENNKENGVWKKWDSTGRLIDSSVFVLGKKISSGTYTYFKGESYAYHFEDFKNDKMQRISYNDSGKIISEALFTGNRGIVMYYNKEGVKTDSVFTREEREASFPGGLTAWGRYIQDQVAKNVQELMKDNQSGTCRVKFIVDKEGKTKDIEVITMKGSLLADVAVRAIKKSP